MSKNERNVDFLAKNLKQLIDKNHLKNTEVAKHLNLSRSAITNYTKGSTPTLDTFVELGLYFDVSLDSLVSAESEYQNATLNEDGQIAFNIPLFHKQVASSEVIYRDENYLGIITSPIPLEEDLDCYAIKAYDDSMKSFGIAFGSLVIFSAATEVKNGDIAVVLIKSKKQLYIRSVKKSDKIIELHSDNGKEAYKITKSGCDAVLLGKVCSASFFPNK